MERANSDIYELAKDNGLRLWWIAYELRMQDSNFARLLRKPLPKEKREQVIAAIHKLKTEISCK